MLTFFQLKCKLLSFKSPRERETNDSNLEAKKNQVVILRFSIHVQYRFNADLMRLFEDLEKKLA